MRALLERFDNDTARIDNFILLASVLAQGDSVPEVMENFLQDADEKRLSELFGPVPEYLKEDIEAGNDEAIMEWLYESGRFGFLIEFATPVMTPSGSGTGARYSWGHYRMQWVYGDTLDAALDAGFAWVAGMRKKEGVLFSA